MYTFPAFISAATIAYTKSLSSPTCASVTASPVCIPTVEPPFVLGISVPPVAVPFSYFIVFSTITSL